MSFYAIILNIFLNDPEHISVTNSGGYIQNPPPFAFLHSVLCKSIFSLFSFSSVLLVMNFCDHGIWQLYMNE